MSSRLTMFIYFNNIIERERENTSMYTVKLVSLKVSSKRSSFY